MVRFFAFIQRHPGKTLLSLLLLCLLCIPSFLSLQIRSDIESVLPDSDPQARAYKEQLSLFPGAGSGYLVMIDGPGPRQVIAHGLRLADTLKNALPGVRTVVGMDTAWINANGLWLLPPSFLELFSRHLKGAAPHDLLTAVNATLAEWEPDGADARAAGGRSPETWIRGWIDLFLLLRLSPDSMERAVPGALQDAFSGPPVQLSADGTSGWFALYLPGNEIKGRDEFEFVRRLIETVSRLNTGEVRASVTGNMVLAYEESNNIQSEINRATAVASLIMILFLILVFRELPQITAMAVSMAFATALAAGLTALLTGGTIHVITASFLLLLLGMGIDFSAFLVHSAIRSADPPRAVADALRPLALSAGTTVIVFLCLAFTGIPPLVQLGWVVALGLAVTLVISAVVAPAVIALFRSRIRPRPVRETARLSPRTFHVVTAILVVLAAGGIAAFFGSQMETDVRKLNIKRLPAARTLDRMVERFNLYPASLQMVCPRIDSLKSLTDGLRKDPMVSKVSSALDLVPAPAAVPAMEASLQRMRAPAARVRPDSDALKRELTLFSDGLAEYAQLAYVAGRFDLHHYLARETTPGSRLARLTEDLGTGKISGSSMARFETLVGGLLALRMERLCAQPPFTLDGLPAVMRERFFPEDEKSGASLVYVSLHRDIWKREVIDRVRQNLSPRYPVLTGSALLSNRVIDMVVHRGGLALLAALILCTLVLFLDLRSWRRAFFGMFPILAALCCGGYIFYTGHALGVPLLNYVSVCSLVLISGIGLEYSVHAFSSHGGDRAVVAKSLFTSGVLSILGFGGIAFCSHAGLRGFGLTLSLGLAICLVFSFIANAARE